MSIEITLERRHIPLSPQEAALATAATNHQALHRQVGSKIALKSSNFTTSASSQVNESTLRWWLHRSFEELVPDMSERLKFFLSFQRSFYYELGFAPLYYFSYKSGGQDVSICKSTFSVVLDGAGKIIVQ